MKATGTAALPAPRSCVGPSLPATAQAISHLLSVLQIRHGSHLIVHGLHPAADSFTMPASIGTVEATVSAISSICLDGKLLVSISRYSKCGYPAVGWVRPGDSLALRRAPSTVSGIAHAAEISALPTAGGDGQRIGLCVRLSGSPYPAAQGQGAEGKLADSRVTDLFPRAVPTGSQYCSTTAVR